jgi:RHS repeat-associated protein
MSTHSANLRSQSALESPAITETAKALFSFSLSMVKRPLWLFLLAALIATNTFAQNSNVNPNPTQGPPTTLYTHGLSDFEQINLFDGSFNFLLPLLTMGGRGSAGHTVMLPITNQLSIERGPSSSINIATRYVKNTADSKGDASPYPRVYSPGFMNVAALQGIAEQCLDRYGEPYFIDNDQSTVLRFTWPDGSTTEFRDAIYDGKFLPAAGCNGHPAVSRGKIFKSKDGSGMTFVSGSDVYDKPFPQISGNLMMPDGTVYRILSNLVVSIRDRNGNTISFEYEDYSEQVEIGSTTVTVTKKRVKTVIDPLRRKAELIYNVIEEPYGTCDQIKYTGFAGAAQTIRVCKTNLDNALKKPEFSVLSYAQLFPGFQVGNNNQARAGNFDPTVISSVWLPNGQRFNFFYNSYSELVRVELPLGGVVEYDWKAGMTDQNVTDFYSNNESYRRMVERRVYPDGVTLESKTQFSRPEKASYRAPTPIGASGSGNFTFGGYVYSSTIGYVDVDSIDPAQNDKVLSRTRHHFYDHAAYADGDAIYFSRWKRGKEWKTEIFGENGSTLLRTNENKWEQRAHVSWYDNRNDATYQFEPSYDPHVTETKSTLGDTGQDLRKTFSFDRYNNQTDTYEYDFDNTIMRHTHVEYITINPANNLDYAANGIHILNLPKEQWLSTDLDGVNKKSLTTFEYDNYTQDANHEPLKTYELTFSGLDSVSTADYKTRGNLTSVSRHLLDNGQSVRSIMAYQQYDLAGNVVKTIDGRGKATTIDFQDCFGTPDGELQPNTSPTELGTQERSYAFATTVTNALGHTSTNQYDYYQGAVVDSKDANGIVNSSFYNDQGRLTQVIRANKTNLKNQTTFDYNYTSRLVTSTSDLSQFGDNVLKTEKVYDGLERLTEARQYEKTGKYISVKQEYDALGRIQKQSNPYRPYDPNDSLKWTTFEYDALGRARVITTPDGAKALVDYQGLNMLSTDQAGKQRLSQVNALGQLTDVWEITNADSYTEPVSFSPEHPEITSGYRTQYERDILDNLSTVKQGGQLRIFEYNSLSQLTSAKNPESGTTLYDYDDNGNLWHKTDARLIKTTYTYDDLNRLKIKAYSDGKTPTVTYTYDLATVANSKGRLTSVSSTVSTTNYTAYNALGRVTSSNQVTDGNTYTFPVYDYDLAGNLQRQVYPSGLQVGTNYDSAGRISEVWGNWPANCPPGWDCMLATQVYADSFSYAPHGAVESMMLGNVLWEQVKFNSRLQPIQIGLGTSSTDTSKLKIDYDYGTTTNNGNIQSQKITLPGLQYPSVQSYNYDQLNRLQSVEEKSNGATQWKQTFSYDRFGNRSIDTSLENNQPKTTPALVGINPKLSPVNNRIERRAGSNEQYLYDDDGNLTKDQDGNTFVYDAENRQTQYFISTNLATPVANYAYDGNGERVKKEVGNEKTIFVYNAFGQLIAEYSNSIPNANGTRYITSDPLGSPRVITDQAGEVKERHDYFPFGEEIDSGWSGRVNVQGYGAGQLRTKFTGKERDDESGLDFFNARYYSSAQGRFTSVDPDNYQAMRDQSDPQSWNAYAYVNNNPLNRVDPDGKGWLDKLWQRIRNWEYGFRTDEQVQQLEDKWRNWLRDREKDAGGTLIYCPGGCGPGSQSYKVNIDALSRNEVFRYAAELKEALQSGNIVVYSKEQIDKMAGLDNPIVGAAAGPVMNFAAKQLQKKFKHANDFGVSGNYNSANASKFQKAIEDHLANADTKVINGTYRGQSVTHYVNPNTGLNVMKDASGNFLSGWKLNPSQLTNVLTRGKL